MAPRTVAVIGDLNIDVILGELTDVPAVSRDVFAARHAVQLGGSAGIVAHGLAALGHRVELYTAIGRDLFADYLTEELRSVGAAIVNLAIDPDSPTGLSVAFSHGGDRGFLSVPIPQADWRSIAAVLDRRPSHLHVSSHPHLPGLQAPLADLVPRLRASGTPVSLDPAGPPSRSAEPLKALCELGRIDFLFVNQQEAAQFGLDSHSAIQAALGQLCDVLVIKRGDQGAVAYTSDATVQTPAPRCRAIETTGAGDSFAAGFLHAWFASQDLALALRFAALCGSAATEHYGGIAAHSRFPELYRDLRPA